MGLMILSCLVAMLLIAVSVVGCGGSSNDGSQPTPAKTTGAAKKSGGPTAPKSGSKADMLRRLKVLADTVAPKELDPGAVNYEVMQESPSKRVDYVCPTCGEKTLYVQSKDTIGLVGFVERDLKPARRLVKQIKGLTVSLDESTFCRKCKPDAKKRQLALLIDYGSSKALHRVEGVTTKDLQILKEFLDGDLKHHGGHAGETPLKTHIGRLETLLGVKLSPMKTSKGE